MRPPDKGNHRVAIITAIFSALILFLALYSSSFEFVVRQAKDTAGALFRSVNNYQSPVSESADLFSQMTLWRSRIETHVATTIASREVRVAVNEVESSVPMAMVLENSQTELVGYIDGGRVAERGGELGKDESAEAEQPTNLQTVVQSFEVVADYPIDVKMGLAVVEAIDTHEQIFLVRFGFDSAELDENSLTTIQRAIEAIQDRLEGVAVVAGYSDPFGSTAYNLELSRKRAQAVADSLLALGVSGDRLRVEGRGTYAALDITANEETLEMGRIAQIIIEESSEW